MGELIYLVPLGVIAFLLFLYDVHDMRRLDSVGLRYLRSTHYYPCYLLRLAGQIALANGLFFAPNWLLSGNTDLTAPNVIGAVVASCGVLILGVWREERARADPQVTSLFGLFQLWKIDVVNRLIRGEQAAVERRLLRTSEWLLKRLGTKDLKATYRRVYQQRYGRYAASQAKEHLRYLRQAYAGDDAGYRQAIADSIGEVATAGAKDRILHAIGRGRFRGGA